MEAWIGGSGVSCFVKLEGRGGIGKSKGNAGFGVGTCTGFADVTSFFFNGDGRGIVTRVCMMSKVLFSMVRLTLLGGFWYIEQVLDELLVVTTPLSIDSVVNVGRRICEPAIFTWSKGLSFFRSDSRWMTGDVLWLSCSSSVVPISVYQREKRGIDWNQWLLRRTTHSNRHSNAETDRFSFFFLCLSFTICL